MIKLERPERPAKLTDSEINNLTLKYKNQNIPVWNRTYIKNSLLKMSNYKCCYCETKLNEESKYLTIDHFHPKNKYPNEVISWENLLPACANCNSKKGNHDTIVTPIINPTVNNPKDYLYFYSGFYYSKNNNILGENTIDVLDLNNIDLLVLPRYKIVVSIVDELSRLDSYIDEYIPNDSNVIRRNKIISSITQILKQALPDKEYSALVATTVLECPSYCKIKDKLKKYNLWSDELQKLEVSAKNISLIRDI